MVFDDFYPDAAWNRSAQDRTTLLLDIDQPLPRPPAVLNRRLLNAAGWQPDTWRPSAEPGGLTPEICRQRAAMGSASWFPGSFRSGDCCEFDLGYRGKPSQQVSNAGPSPVGDRLIQVVLRLAGLSVGHGRTDLG